MRKDSDKLQPASQLVPRRVALDTYRENEAYLHRDCAVVRAEGFQALCKVQVRANGRHILAALNVVDDSNIVACDELGLSEDAYAQMRGLTVTPSRSLRLNRRSPLARCTANWPVNAWGEMSFSASCATSPTCTIPKSS